MLSSHSKTNQDCDFDRLVQPLYGRFTCQKKKDTQLPFWLKLQLHSSLVSAQPNGLLEKSREKD